MAGRGSRFTQEGYTDSKPFIDVNGKPMIQRVIENLNFEFNPKFKTVILCQKSDFEKYDFSIFEKIIGHSNIEIIQIDGITEGAACTLLLAKEFIDNNGDGSCEVCRGSRNPESSDNPGKAIISLQNDRSTSYETYIRVQNELVAAYNELREELAQQQFGKSYSLLGEEAKKFVQDKYPQILSEAEPVSLGGR